MKPKGPKRDGKTSRINQQKKHEKNYFRINRRNLFISINHCSNYKLMETLKKSLSIIILVATGFAIVGICLTAWNFIFHLFNL